MEKHFLEVQKRDEILSPFEIFVEEKKLTKYQDTSSAQIHDWLKEHHPEIPERPPHGVYNFVMFVK
ncbi:MAG TPA: hypothetical protein VFF35_10635 [Bacteroidia bacterium]|nr:hypothetical protein [Bacteroidia bacterium]